MRPNRSSHFRRQALTLIEVIAVIVVLTTLLLVIGAIRPWSSRCGSISPKLLCASNLKGISTSSKIYANENIEYWPTPAYDKSMEGKIDYRVPVGGGVGTAQSPNRSQPSISGPEGAKELSVSRALWMLVRSGDITPNRLICPQSGDVEDPSNSNLDDYYDFAGWTNLSYGYQVPFGPYDTRARERADSKVVFVADKGPYRNATVPTPPPDIVSFSHGRNFPKPNDNWKPYNSQNHGSEGQNVLFADGHSEYQRAPTVGVDGDNIYTIALDNFNEASRTSGESPWLRSSPPFSSTDSVIFP